MQEQSPVLEARSGEGIIFLDLKTDEYSCRYDHDFPVEDYFCAAEAEMPTNRHRAVATAANRWLDLPTCVRSRPSMNDVMRFIAALGEASICFRGRSVRELSRITNALGRRHAEKHVCVEDVARIFDRLLAMLPLQPECLFRSFFLLHFLGRYGLRADWVFGVQLFPFRAHCWVACESRLLNEVSHAIEDYQVIYRTGQTLG